MDKEKRVFISTSLTGRSQYVGTFYKRGDIACVYFMHLRSIPEEIQHNRTAVEAYIKLLGWNLVPEHVCREAPTEFSIWRRKL